MLAISKEVVVIIVADAQRKRGCVGCLTAPHLQRWRRVGWCRALPQPLKLIGLRRRLLATGEDKVVILIFSGRRSGSHFALGCLWPPEEVTLIFKTE
jgi:hypothetical protein